MASPLDNLTGPGKPLRKEPPDAKEYSGLKRSVLPRISAGQSLHCVASIAAHTRFASGCLACTRQLSFRPQSRRIRRGSRQLPNRDRNATGIQVTGPMRRGLSEPGTLSPSIDRATMVTEEIQISESTADRFLPIYLSWAAIRCAGCAQTFHSGRARETCLAPGRTIAEVTVRRQSSMHRPRG